MKMTFEEWQAARVESADVEMDFLEAYGEPSDDFAAVITYTDGSMIEKLRDGSYHLMMSIFEYESIILTELEVQLWNDHSQYNCQD